MFRLILTAILPEKMSDEEKKMLNEYHAAVYEKVGIYLEENEREWLKQYQDRYKLCTSANRTMTVKKK